MAIALAGGAALATLAAVQAYGGIAAVNRPSSVLALNPRHPVANMVVAERTLTDQPSPATIQAARAPAVETLRAQPLAPEALRLVALAAFLDRREEQAEAVMRLAARTSKRDITTNLWLIDRSVLDGDIEGALRFFNRSLTLEPDMGDLLFPILANAIDDPNIFGPASVVLAKQPQWARPFYNEALGNPAATRAVARMMLKFGNRARELNRDQRQIILERLADNGDAELASRLYLHMTGETNRALLRNGDFSAENRWPPFDWQFFVDESIETFASDSGTGNVAVLAGARQRRYARQLLTLRPGGYRLVLDSSIRGSGGERVGGGEARLEARVTCVARGKGRLGQLRATPAIPRVAGSFAVPADCATQWLTLYVNGDDSRRTSEIELRAVRLEPAG